MDRLSRIVSVTVHAVVTVSPIIEACDNGTLHVSAVFGSTDTAATKTTAP